MNYDDIIDLPHHVSSRHPQMPMEARAAQFAPFAALTGHRAVLAETARLTDEQSELDAQQAALLNQQLQRLHELLPKKPQVTISYFQHDAHKAGGAFRSVSGQVKKIDDYALVIHLSNGTQVQIPDIVDICISDN